MVAAAAASAALGALPLRTPEAAPPDRAQPSTVEPGGIETAEEAST